MEEFLNSQKNSLGITDFLQNAKLYTETNFPDLDINTIFDNSLTGNISTNFWTTSILDLAGKEVKLALNLMITVLIVIIIHSIFKAITENLVAK